MAEVPIHGGGPSRAESPYKRKLARLVEDMRLVRSMAPIEDADKLAVLIIEIGFLMGESRG